mmetsp:Transcript_42644/g.91467  ORF Transcript_42644/g.91467 Transcript_42644/m.91467 type:complete len:221 (-) Transcript_42644:180-842(-)|eukprot:CAMPEP_0206435206 /NCGR_PEP_ID=MMETSP0324_2-20121206/9691_1 /ASSEMBLY_ACC=CAM_ASM_000836 /TAXON_ID=2866 /ORGANISM="Crypthecodinium cohnii, Strain Seligo" /LENGTH=220 /DNA_ID=CAMNT_0053902019 /DNA_START=82 /DNA_END=744 /DNA_ORIENTATION=+
MSTLLASAFNDPTSFHHHGLHVVGNHFESLHELPCTKSLPSSLHAHYALAGPSEGTPLSMPPLRVRGTASTFLQSSDAVADLENTLLRSSATSRQVHQRVLDAASFLKVESNTKSAHNIAPSAAATKGPLPSVATPNLPKSAGLAWAKPLASSSSTHPKGLAGTSVAEADLAAVAKIGGGILNKQTNQSTNGAPTGDTVGANQKPGLSTLKNSAGLLKLP